MPIDFYENIPMDKLIAIELRFRYPDSEIDFDPVGYFIFEIYKEEIASYEDSDMFDENSEDIITDVFKFIDACGGVEKFIIR